MEQERKYFADQDGRGNFDDASFALGINEWLNAENVRSGSTDAGRTGIIESVGSNRLISEPLPSATFITIGSVDDAENDRIIFFKKNTTGPWDRIECYSLADNTVYIVLLAAQVVGGLSFNKNYPIHSTRVVNGILYWTDDLNQPRRLNIDAAIKLNQPSYNTDVEPYQSPLNAEVITVIRKPPARPLLITKQTNNDVNTNLIKNSAFRFAYMYTYRDYEKSTLSMHSLLSPYNYPDEDYNQVQLVIPFTEIPDQDVLTINIAVIYATGEVAFFVKTWDKRNPIDAQEIENHIDLITPLTYLFNNDSVGDAVDPAYKVKPFDSVPLKSKALEIARNRLFLGDNIIGYDTPTITSLQASVYDQNSDEGVTGIWSNIVVQVQGDPDVTIFYMALFSVPIDDTHPAGFYTFIGDPPLSMPGPSEIDIDDYEYVSDISNYTANVASWYEDYYGNVFEVISCSADLVAGDPVTTSQTLVDGNVSILKSDSPYRLGVVFYDQYMRQCGVVTSPDNRVTTPDREYSLSNVYNYGIQWSLDAGSQEDEIPDWAYYYSIVSTKSLRTNYFIQSRSSQIIYARKDADGVYVFDTNGYSSNLAGVALKLDLLEGYGMGYSYQEGDIIKVYIESVAEVYSLGVIGVDGNWVIGELADVGSTTGVNAFFEIYTPTLKNAENFFYEIGAMYSILNPTQSIRAYSTLSGVLPGDVYLLRRDPSGDDYITENMSPSTTYWRNWYTNAGRVQIIDRIGQSTETNTIAYSNTFIAGTRENGLSSFEALNEKQIPLECGPIQKLQVTSKVGNQQGIVMLCICTDQTSSLYIEEVQQYGSNQQTTLTVFADVIGTINVLKGNYGTNNPESVIEYRGLVFWIDVANGRVIQYAGNGLYPISNYKMTRFWKLFSLQYMSMTSDQIEALGSRPFIFMTVDPAHDELLISIPRLLESPPKGYLPDYPEVIYPFDIWDGQAKTVVYNLINEPNFWRGSYSMTPEGFITAQNRLFMFKNGLLYEGNQTDSQCNFFGIQYKPKVMCVGNMIPTKPKVYQNVAVESNIKPSFVYFYNDYPYQQSSDLDGEDFIDKEGVFYSAILRNKLIPTEDGYETSGLLTGEVMRNTAMYVMVEFTVSNVALSFKFFYIGFSISKGQSVQ